MITNILIQLGNIVGHSNIISEPTAKSSYEIDWRGSYKGNSQAVVKPQQVNQLQQIIRLCQTHNIAIVPQGGQTSLCGAAVPVDNLDKPQIIINLSLLNKILSINLIDNCITVEAGCTLSSIIDYAKSNDRFFPLDIGAKDNCQIGGVIATNAGGIHVIKYGMLRNLVMGLEVVLPNGEIINQLNILHKNNTFLDLKQLFVGSEGALGIITKANLKLYPTPKNLVSGLIGVKNLEQAFDILQFFRDNFDICAFEIIHNQVQHLYNKHFANEPFPINDEWLILFEVDESSDFILSKIPNLLNNLSLNYNQIIITENYSEAQKLWQMREKIPLAEKMHGLAIKHDIALPLSQLPNFIQANRKNILNSFPHAQIFVFGHLGDGSLHYNIQLKDLIETKSNQTTINQIVYNDVLKFSGSISAEHGIGQLKTKLFKQTCDSSAYLLAKQIKKLIDPNNILNPGKIFEKNEFT